MIGRPSILIVGSGISEEYRGYALRSVAEAYAVVLLDDAAPTWQRPLIAGSAQADLSDGPSAVHAALALARSHPIAGVLSWDERRIELAAVIAAELGLPHSPPEAVRNCRDKWSARRLFDRAGVPSARARLVATLDQARAAAAAIGYPVVLKPRALAGSIGVVRADTEDALEADWASVAGATLTGIEASGEVLVEEYLDGPEFSVECLSQDGAVTALAVTRKSLGMAPYFEELGHVVDAVDAAGKEEAAIADAATDAVRALGITTGATHVEVRLTTSGPRLVEVNARLGGDLIPHLVHLATGIDLVRAAADVAVGARPGLEPTSARSAGIRFVYPPHAGVVRELGSAPELSADPRFSRLVWMSDPGDRVALPPEEFVDRLGFLIGTGDSAQAVTDFLGSAEAFLEVDVQPRSGA
ncbi:carboxylase [Rathayibacter tritici]|uniref:ATP-grasp domain-containing protein n=1 Tax=Rathayibacter tritici TaxID=33888 RepID=UPI000CE8F46E|nr:ATP-grasp domain-containing protein [Rathayibacter tritici]PPF66680.1 carboxylase [Rathayibacter tritici]PPG09065.1 carboxylase [Rathayibacter tritici]